MLGVGWERIIFPWNLFQPNGPDDFNTSAVPQAYLDAAQAAGREVVGLIKGTPPWASESGALAAVPNGLWLPHDDPDNVFGAFVRMLVEYYSPRGIHHWIIWNEPDIRPGEGDVEFDGEVQDYFALLRTAYLAARSVDPTVHIQVAGMAWWYDVNRFREPYLLRLLRVIAADPAAHQNNWYFDGISLHIYFTTSDVWSIIMANRRFLLRFGLQDKAIWLSEFNASPRRDPLARIEARFTVSLEQQADFIVQASALALAAGVERLAVYRLYDNDFTPGLSEPWGLVRADGSLRPAFHAYHQVIQRFSGVQHVRRYHVEAGGTAVTLSFPEHTLYVMWSDAFNAGEFLINVGGSDSAVTVYDAVGSLLPSRMVAQWGTQLAVIEAPAAEPIDLATPVVSGGVRLVELPGQPRTMWFRAHDGQVTQLN